MIQGPTVLWGPVFKQASRWTAVQLLCAAQDKPATDSEADAAFFWHRYDAVLHCFGEDDGALHQGIFMVLASPILVSMSGMVCRAAEPSAS